MSLAVPLIAYFEVFKIIGEISGWGLYAHNLLIFKHFLLFSVERVGLRLKQEDETSAFRKLCEYEQ